MPILIGGGGERVTLRLVAEHADAWNSFGPAASFRHKNQVLDEWCADVGRDPADIERTVAISPDEIGALDEYRDAGAEHVIVMMAPPYDLDPVRQILEA
jgi:alkanesulfonate monooxygenase SsuD/methylene tetrahydromethanopterin reductase-like flavin-dependent oxidoreductase (luciferase family)